MVDDVVAELDAELALIEELPYRVPIHHLAQRARDEIMALRGLLEHSDRTVITAVAVATPAIRDAALEEAARACERRRDMTGEQSAYAVLDVESYTSACSGCAYDIRALALKGTARDE